MAYDEDLADRVRELLATETFTEKRMFGGLAFLLGGHMAVAAASAGTLMVRVDPEQAPELLERAGAQPMEMQGRTMKGWLTIDAEHVRTTRQVAPWVERGVAFVRTLPPKKPKR